MKSPHPKPPRRRLEFHDFNELLQEAESLHAGGYDQDGNWNLGQVCGHLADWISYPIDGFPRPPAPIRLAFWGFRKTIGPRKRREFLENRSMPAGAPTFPESVPPADGDETAALRRLRQSIERFQSHTGAIHPSPLFGQMDKITAERLQLVHGAHHLSFLAPRSH